MQKIDANIVLRYILDDHETLSPKAREIIDNQIVEVPVEALCEVVYVLNGHYKVDRLSISIKLQEFFEKTSCVLSHREAVLRGLEYFGKTTIDFVDCILAGYTEVEHDEVYTFDNQLQKLILEIKNNIEY
jgi:predicted nucleic-acid-binding protein